MTIKKWIEENYGKGRATSFGNFSMDRFNNIFYYGGLCVYNVEGVVIKKGRSTGIAKYLDGIDGIYLDRICASLPEVDSALRGEFNRTRRVMYSSKHHNTKVYRKLEEDLQDVKDRMGRLEIIMHMKGYKI